MPRKRKDNFRSMNLGEFFPRQSTQDIFRNNSESCNDLSNHSYSRESMVTALEIEDLARQYALIEFDVTDAEICFETDEDEYEICSCSIQKVPMDLNELSLVLVSMNVYKGERFIERSNCMFTNIEWFDKKKKILYFYEGNRCRIVQGQRYHVRFEYNRVSFRACHYALEKMEELGLIEYFKDFNSVPARCNKKSNSFHNLHYFNQSIADDSKQDCAVKNVLSNSFYPFPFVISGGPGTGKTTVMVECVAQILKLSPRSHILITTQSNSAADEIGVRMLQYLSLHQIFRYFSQGQAKSSRDKYTAELRKSSTLSTGKFQTPTYQEFYGFQVVIITMVASNRLVMANIRKNHFDYIFIDECCAAIEPECLIPIIGLGMEQEKVNASIVLLGDENLLGPKIDSDQATGMQLGVSLLERILKNPRNQVESRHVRLQKNYRSHPEIVRFSNEIFYNNEMESRVSRADKNFALDWEILPNKKVPMIFHTIEAACKEDDESKSLVNEDEQEQVVNYVHALLKKAKQEDIGVVSPYKAQIKEIKTLLKNYLDITCGTTEFFQGREKPIMIISMVISQKRTSSFAGESRRLNVLLTRAKSLMIVVGSRETLRALTYWNEFIDFCDKNQLCKEKLQRADELNKKTELNLQPTYYGDYPWRSKDNPTLIFNNTRAVSSVRDQSFTAIRSDYSSDCDYGSDDYNSQAHRYNYTTVVTPRRPVVQSVKPVPISQPSVILPKPAPVVRVQTPKIPTVPTSTIPSTYRVTQPNTSNIQNNPWATQVYPPPRTTAIMLPDSDDDVPMAYQRLNRNQNSNRSNDKGCCVIL